MVLAPVFLISFLVAGLLVLVAAGGAMGITGSVGLFFVFFFPSKGILFPFVIPRTLVIENCAVGGCIALLDIARTSFM